MARRKNPPESIRVKCDLAERLRGVRTDLFGERGGPELARRLGIPVRTWYNYESGVTVPAEVILRFVEMTAVEPAWLLDGKEPKYRSSKPVPRSEEIPTTVEQLLRSALRQLEEREESNRIDGLENGDLSRRLDYLFPAERDIVLLGVEGRETERLTASAGPRYEAARDEWLAARRDLRCARIEGDAMAPIAANGAYIAYSAIEESPEQLDGKMVAARHEGKTIVRWLSVSGAYALLRVENEAFEPATILINIQTDWNASKVRRVLWITTPH